MMKHQSMPARSSWNCLDQFICDYLIPFFRLINLHYYREPPHVSKGAYDWEALKVKSLSCNIVQCSYLICQISYWIQFHLATYLSYEAKRSAWIFIQQKAFIMFRIAIDVLLILMSANSIFVNALENVLRFENCSFIFNIVKFVMKKKNTNNQYIKNLVQKAI